MEQERVQNILVIWRDKHLNVEVNSDCKMKEFGQILQKLTNVRSDTLRLLVAQATNKSSRLITPFFDDHSGLSLQQAGVVEGKPIRMLGVSDEEVKEVSEKSVKADLRILGFEEEEQRLRQRSLNRPQASLKLPQGAYIFCDFRTLHLPGIELNPPPSEALRRMHILACDPGIIAIMNKHHWRVGIMTEMAPLGYVGISPKCLLGFNKNHGEEISLRLRTDDLKGFRKYESIKKTLLHELAHMVHSEHDANFLALNKQLNKEADSLDWTKSKSHTISGRKALDHYEEGIHSGDISTYTGQKLGGVSNSLATARALSVGAAYHRLSNREKLSEANPDDAELKQFQEKIHAEPDPDDSPVIEKDAMHVDILRDDGKPSSESSIHKENDDPDSDERLFEPDPDDFHEGEAMVPILEPDPDDSQVGSATESFVEPDPDDSRLIAVKLGSRKMFEPDPDDSSTGTVPGRRCAEPVTDDHARVVSVSRCQMERDSSSSQKTELVKAEPDPDDRMDGLDTEVLQRIEEPVAAVCARIQRAIEMLRSELTPLEATSALQTLFKIIRNVIEHPDEVKFRRLRKANPQVQRNVMNYKAAMEVLTMIGFSEDSLLDEVGKTETYLVLKRNDPGLLWLAKSSLEVSMA